MSNRRVSWNSPAVVFAVVFCLVLATATLVTRELSANNGRRKTPSAPSFVANWKELAAVGHQTGSRSAPVTVVIFADYQCPGCAEFHRRVRMAQDSLRDTLRVVTRHFPLSIHPQAAPAANAAECASDQGRFDAYEDVLYASQDSIGKQPYNVFAVHANIRDTVEFAKCVKSGRHASVVRRDAEAARALKFAGTPAYLVNGATHFGAPEISALLDELRKAALAAPAQVTATGELENPFAVGAARSGGPVQRRWLTPPEVERTITGESPDEFLMPANLVRTGSNDLALFDFGNMEVRAFSLNGRPLWRTGRRGSGPGEFRNAMDLKLRGNGELAVLDMANRRITTITAAGRVLRTIPVRLTSPRLVPLSDTTWFAMASEDTSSLWSGVNLAGDTLRREASPAALRARHAMEREAFTASMADGAVIAYRWSDKFALLNANGSLRAVVPGIEPVAFPGTKAYPLKAGKFKGMSYRISPDAVRGAMSITSIDGDVLVLFGGASPESGRIIDIYSARDGAYKGSRLLPFVVAELVALPGGRIATLRNEPVPSVDILRLRDTNVAARGVN